MGISWNSRVIADASAPRIHGARMVGGYVLRLGVDFHVSNWDEPTPPTVIFAPAWVSIDGPAGPLLGMAPPELMQPFTVSQYAATRGVLFDLSLAPAAMEALERHRNGLDITLTVKLQAEVRRGAEVQIGWDELTARFNISQWTAALEQAGYGRTLIFEVPIPDEPRGLRAAIELLASARRLLSAGHYGEVVAKCRMVLEQLTHELGEGPKLEAAWNQRRSRDCTAEQRELSMRQAAINFAHLAHHPTDEALGASFDRNSAQMMLGITAALVSSATGRRAESVRDS